MKSPAELAAEFDRAFALAPPEEVPHADVLGIDIAGARYALSLADLRGLFVDRAITRVPATRRELRGIAGFRGTLVPVFDLAAVLGHPSPPAARWLAVAAGAPIAFAFERLDGHLRVPASAADGAVIVAADKTYSRIDLPALLASLVPGR